MAGDVPRAAGKVPRAMSRVSRKYLDLSSEKVMAQIWALDSMEGDLKGIWLGQGGELEDYLGSSVEERWDLNYDSD